MSLLDRYPSGTCEACRNYSPLGGGLGYCFRRNVPVRPREGCEHAEIAVPWKVYRMPRGKGGES